MSHRPHRFALALLAALLLYLPGPAAGQDAFSVVVLPDTQFYSEKYPETYLVQTRWIRDHAKAENIRFVVHLGDIVQHNNDSEAEWQAADRAQRVLDGVVPYSMLPGNHDLGCQNKQLTRNTVLYNKYFPPGRFEKYPWYGGHFGDTNDNNFCLFQAAGMRFIVLSLEYVPRDEVLDWANRVVADHPHHRVIVATHCYMRVEGRDADCGGLPGNCGNAIWNKLIRRHENIFLVVSGHILGVGRQTSRNDAGRPVYETLVDYQGLPHGGDGWLRIMRFVPGQDKIEVRAYSPLLDRTNDAPEHTFTLEYQMHATAAASG